MNRSLARLGLALSLISLSVIRWSPASAADFKSGERVDVRGELAESLFAAGGDVALDVTGASENVFLAGGQVGFRGKAAQSVVAAGGGVTISDAQVRQLVVAGGNVRVDRTQIAKDLVAAGGQVIFGPESRVAGTADIAGGEVTLAGNFGGDVRVSAQSLRVEPSAVIAGNLIHRTEKIDLSQQARVQGETIARGAPPSTRDYGKGAVVFGTLLLLGTLLVAPVVATLFAGTARGASEHMRTRFWECLGKGVVISLALPLAWIAALVTGIGTPVALALLPLLVFGAVLAWSISVFTLGQGLRTRLKKHGRPFLWTLAASLLFLLLLWVPVAGLIIGWLAYVTGVGALWAQLRVARH